MTMIKKIRKKPEWLVIGLIFFFRILYYGALEYKTLPDSWEYLARDGFSWLHGTLDRYRLPVYPMILDIAQWLSADQYQLLVCSLQLLVSLLSVIVLYWTVKKLVDKKWVCLLVTTLYGTFSAVSGWDKTLLTESLSLSLTVFVIYGIVSFIRNKKYRYVWITSGCLLVGCFLRAVFAIYAGLFLGFLLLITIFPSKSTEAPSPRNQRLTTIKSALIALIPVAMLFVYAGLFYGQHGAFTLSDSGLGQKLYIVLVKGYYEDSSDQEMKEIADTILSSSASSALETELDGFLASFYQQSDISDGDMQQLKGQMLSMVDNTLDPSLEEALDGYVGETYGNHYDASFTTRQHLGRCYIMENYDRDRIVAFVDESMAGKTVPRTIDTVLNSFDEFVPYNTHKDTLYGNVIYGSADVNFLKLSLLHSLLITGLELLIFLAQALRKKKADWVRLGLGTYIGATVLLSLLGTNGEFARTAITALPFMFVAIGLYLDRFTDLLLRRRKETTDTVN